MKRYLLNKVHAFIDRTLSTPHYSLLLFTHTYYSFFSLIHPSHQSTTNQEAESFTNQKVKSSTHQESGSATNQEPRTSNQQPSEEFTNQCPKLTHQDSGFASQGPEFIDQNQGCTSEGPPEFTNRRPESTNHGLEELFTIEGRGFTIQGSEFANHSNQDQTSSNRGLEFPNQGRASSTTNSIGPKSTNHIARFKSLLFYIHYILFTMASFSTLINLLFIASQDSQVFYLQYFIAFYCFMIFIDYNVFLILYDKRKQLLTEIAHSFITSGRISRRCLTSEVWFSIISSVLLATSYVMFMVQPFLIEKVTDEEMAVYNRTHPHRRYSVELFTAFDYSVSPYFEIGFVYVLYTGINIQTITFETVTTLPILTLHIKGQLDLISSYLRTIGNDSVNIVDIKRGTIIYLRCTTPRVRRHLHSVTTKHLLIQLIRHHQTITRIIRRFSRIHQPVFGLRIFLSTSLIIGILCQYAFTNNTHILFVVSNMFTILQFHFFFNFTSEMLHSGYANVHSALIHNNWYSALFVRSHGNQCKQREFRRHSNYERVLGRNHSNEERSQSSRCYRDQDFLETPRCYGAKGYQEAPAASCFHSNTADVTNKDIASCSRCHSNTADVTNKDIVQLLSIMLTLTNMKSNQYLTFSRFHRIGFVNFVSCIKTAYSVFLILFKLS